MGYDWKMSGSRTSPLTSAIDQTILKTSAAMVEPDDCLETGEERADRNVETKNRFESLRLEVECPDTAVLLLGSRERSVLAAAAAALTKFAAKAKENVQRLFELDIVESLASLIMHEDLITRRFAARLLAEMASIAFVRNYLTSESWLEKFITIATQDPDAFMREYASLVLAEVSGDPCGVAKILKQCSNLDFILKNIQDPDPDIKRNNAQILDNLIKDFAGADSIIGSSTFSFLPICELLDQPYPEIRNLGLSVLESLVSRTRNEHVQQLFRESGALKILMNLLENVDLADIDSDIVRVLSRAFESSATVETFIVDGGIPQLFRYLEAATGARESRDVLEALVCLGNTTTGREILYNLGLVKYLFENLSSQDVEMKKIVCRGIGVMSHYRPACEQMAEQNSIKLILDILKDENLTCSVREGAAFALKELCILNRRMCHVLQELNGATCLKQLLKQAPGDVSTELAMASIDILTLMGGYLDLRLALVDVDLAESLCASFEVEDPASDQLNIAACRALSTFCLETRARQLFFAGDLAEKLFRLISSESTPVRAAAAQLVQQLSGDAAIAEKFIHLGYLNFMMKNRAVATVVPSWSTCIDSLLSAHLPVKFATTGRISIHETTKDGFYVMRRNVCPFPVLDELFRRKMCPKDPIYVVNFDDQSIEDNNPTSTDLSIDSRNLERKFGRLQKDPYLQEYLKDFLRVLVANESLERIESLQRGLVDVSKIASRARLLGRFVARLMSGPDRENPCVDHQLEIHVREIRDDLETSVIPLGQLRLGGYLERALLFKVLADKICLPSSLVRGQCGKAWNEIAIPQMELPVGEVTSKIRKFGSDSSLHKTSAVDSVGGKETGALLDLASKSILPTSLLQQNYVVDLMNEPGYLIPIDSFKAKSYCASYEELCVASCEI